MYLDNGEHPEGREKVGVCKVEVDGADPANAVALAVLHGEMTFDDDHQWLADLVGTMEVSSGYGPSSGCLVLKPPTHLDERIG